MWLFFQCHCFLIASSNGEIGEEWKYTQIFCLFVLLSGSFIMDTVEISNKGLDVRNRDVWKLMGDVDSMRSIFPRSNFGEVDTKDTVLRKLIAEHVTSMEGGGRT